MKKSFKQFLQEAPLGDYKTHGNWEKNSSFRDPKDRLMIQHPRAIEHVRKKFGNSPYVWNLHFVNSPKANKHTEVGEVSIDWVTENLGEDIANSISESPNSNDSINIIFTNNKGSERKNMSAWLISHRIGHVLKRGKGGASYQYKEAERHLLNNLVDIMHLYNNKNFININGYQPSRQGYESRRRQELTMMYFFHKVATFKSARDKNLRDWFEVLNELIAQYITTGHIKFNEAPQCFGNEGGRNRVQYCTKDLEEANESIQTLARDMEYMIDNIFSVAVGNIFVM